MVDKLEKGGEGEKKQRCDYHQATGSVEEASIRIFLSAWDVT